MSWFSLLLSGKNVWESQNFINDILTGKAIGQLIADKYIKHQNSYLRIREVATAYFCHNLEAPLKRISRKIAVNVLEKAVQHKRLPELFPELFDPLHLVHNHLSFGFLRPLGRFDEPQRPKKPQTLLKDLNSNGVQEFVHLLFDNYVFRDASAYSAKTALKNDEIFQIFVRKAITKSLLPTVEKIIYASFTDLIHSEADHFFDSLISKTISVGTLLISCKIFLEAIEKLAKSRSEYFLNEEFGFSARSLPLASTILWLSLTFYIAEVGKVLWLRIKHHKHAHDDDRQNVKNLALSVAKKPVYEALYQISLFKSLPPKKIKVLTRILIEESIDLSWTDLQKVNFLSLPLVR